MRAKRAHGFSLIEMVVVITVVGILAAIVAVPLSVGMRSYVTGRELLRVHEMGRIAVWRVERELRELRKGNLSVANASTLTFNDAYGQTITYALAGGKLQRNGIALAESVSTLTFTYYDRANNVLGPLPLDQPNRDKVYVMSMDFTLSAGAESYNFRTTIFPRDLKN